MHIHFQNPNTHLLAVRAGSPHPVTVLAEQALRLLPTQVVAVGWIEVAKVRLAAEPLRWGAPGKECPLAGALVVLPGLTTAVAHLVAVALGEAAVTLLTRLADLVPAEG